MSGNEQNVANAVTVSVKTSANEEKNKTSVIVCSSSNTESKTVDPGHVIKHPLQNR